MAGISLAGSAGPIIPKVVALPVGSPTSTGQPANGKTQLFIGPPAGKAWRVKALRSIYTCDATIGGRTLVASLTSASLSNDVWSAAFGTVAQANNLIEVAGGDGGSPGQLNSGATNGGENLSQVINFGWPSTWITFDITLRVWMFWGTGTNDTFSGAFALVEEISV